MKMMIFHNMRKSLKNKNSMININKNPTNVLILAPKIIQTIYQKRQFNKMNIKSVIMSIKSSKKRKLLINNKKTKILTRMKQIKKNKSGLRKKPNCFMNYYKNMEFALKLLLVKLNQKLINR